MPRYIPSFGSGIVVRHITFVERPENGRVYKRWCGKFVLHATKLVCFSALDRYEIWQPS